MAKNESASLLAGRCALAIAASLFSLLTLNASISWGQQSQVKQPEYKGGRGAHAHPAAQAAFKPGPFGPDGKVHQVVPDAKARRFPDEVETPQERDAEVRAAAGLLNPSTKAKANQLSSKQLSLLNWNPNKLDPMQNPIIGSELFQSAEKNGPAAFSTKFGSSSVPAKGKDWPGFGDTGWFPPDGGIAAGPIQLVEVVNSSINVYDKNGNLLSSQSLNSFYSGLGTPGSDFLYDPSVYYDQLTGTFWVLATSKNDSPNRSNVLVAVSHNNDVTQGWYMYALDFTVDGSNSSNNWCDYPHMGMDADALYMSCNQFSFPSSSASFQYAKVRVMTKSQFTSDACCSWWDFWNLKEGFLNLSTSFTVRPALERWVGYGFGDFWVDAEGGGGSGSTLKVWQLTNATACCDGSSGPTLNGNEQGVGSYDSPPAAAQPNGIQGLDTGGSRILYATYQFGHLSVGQTTACSNSGANQACAAFTEMDVSSYPSMSNVNDWVWTESGEDIYYPFVDQNVNSDKTMVYTRSDGSSTYPTAFYIGIPNSGTCTSCVDSEVTMATGSANYDVTDSSGRNRWGDYQGASNDTDFLGIWVTGEYVSGTNTWAKEIDSSYNSYFPIDSPTPTSVSFGNQAIFSSAATQYVTFQNTGNATLYTSTTEITGDSDFFITYDGCSFRTLQPQQSCSEGVSFGPNSIGAGTGYIIVFDNTSATYAYSTLTGTGVKAGTSTSIGSSLNPSTYSQNVTFSAHVFSSTSGTPGGTVSFYNGLALLGTTTLSGGIASLTTNTLSGGSHSITAVYNGSSLFVSSQSTLTQAVHPALTAASITSSLNPSTFGKAVTFTAKVSSGAGTPTGTVTFKDGNTAIGTGTLSSGTATLSTSALAGGTHAITVAYGGATNFATSTSGTLSQVVNKAGSTSAVTASINPSTWHQNVTFTAKVTSAGGIPAGNVTFKDGATALSTQALNASGVATFTTNALAVGAHSITVAYAGNGNFIGGTSPTVSHTVNKASSASAVTASVNPSTWHESVTFTAKVTSSGGIPAGTITFKDGATLLSTQTLNASGIATFTTNALALGVHSITVAYAGNADFVGSTSSALSHTVNKASSASAVTASVNPSTWHESVTFTAKVTSSGGIPAGTITFKDGAITLSTQTLNASGIATFTTNALALGAHSITVAYAGNADFVGSTSSALSHTVNKASSTSTVTASVNPSAWHQNVTFTAKVTSSGGIPAGTITFKDGATVLSTQTLNASGVATFTTNALAVGAHSITVTYAGNADFLGSTSSALSHTVNKAGTTTALASSLNPSTHGSAVTFTATITPAFGGAATGTVTFKDGATTLGTGAVNSSNKATFTTSALATGTHSITAVYPGDTHANGSTSPVVKQVVN